MAPSRRVYSPASTPSWFFLKVVKKDGPKEHAKLDRAQMSSLMEHRRHAASCHARYAVFQTVLRLQLGVGLHHQVAKAGQVITVFFRLVQAQERGGRRGVELKLPDPVTGFQRLIGGQQLC